MPQNTNLNVSPYFDDFDSSKNFNRVLFKPGTPVQARELTTLQSILQGQIEKFGKHMFKEGSMVIPGKFNYDEEYTFVKVESTFFGVPVELYYDKLVGLRIKGKTSGIKAKVLKVLSSSDSTTSDTTLYVKYESTSEDLENQYFIDGENLVTLKDFTYGSTTISDGSDFATCLISNSGGTGSSFTMNRGIYFARGAFVEVGNETLILDQYSNKPSYRVGFFVKEEVITAVDDGSLYDNAAGFSNYTAPGADRLKISLSLTKKELDNFQDENFIELFRADKGEQKKIIDRTQYNIIAEEFARRTFDESGNYYVTKFDLEARESLNDRYSQQGTYFATQKTEEGNTPSKDLMNIRVGPGKAYVRGFEVQSSGHAFLDVDKPRTTQLIESAAVPFEAGNRIRVNNVLNGPQIKLNASTSTDFVDLRSARLASNKSTAAGDSIGRARVYDYKLQNAGYTGNGSVFELFLYDIQSDTKLTLNQAHTIALPAVIEGRSSGARGYLRTAVSGSTTVVVSQVSGQFIRDEQIIINGEINGRTLTDVIEYDLSDVKSVRSTAAGRTFAADVVLEVKRNFAGRSFSITSGGVVTSSTSGWVKHFKIGDIIQYKQGGNADVTYNQVSAISETNSNITVVAAPHTVSGVCHKALPGSTVTVSDLKLVSGKIRDARSGFLYAELGHNYVESVDLTNSSLFVRREYTGNSTDGNGQMSLPSLSGTDYAYAAFDEERYTVLYNDGSVDALTGDQFVLTGSGKGATLSGLTASQSGNVTVHVTQQKNKVKSKQKSLTRNSSITVTGSSRAYSGVSTSVADGLTPNSAYGKRVQDREISLDVCDVVTVNAVFEASGSGDPQVPNLTLASFNGPSGDNSDLIIGEVGVGKSSGASARILSRNGSNKVNVIFTNGNLFKETEEVLFEESGVRANLSDIDNGDPNILKNYILDSGQRAEYYDFARLVRKTNFPEPQGKLLIYFDHYQINAQDSGDLITASSYPRESYNLIPAFNNVRNNDTIDSRPRVAPYSGSRSPFEFDSRDFSQAGQALPAVLVSDENVQFDYNHYLGRIDRLYVNPNGSFTLKPGTPAEHPVEPDGISGSFELARIDYRPYVYDAKKDVVITFRANKRYTMKDIGHLEDRIDVLEEVTSLSLLEAKTDSLTITDPDTGLDRFKNGFVVDPFDNFGVADKTTDSLKYDIDEGKLVSRKYTDTIDLLLGSNTVAGIDGAPDPTVDPRYATDLGSPNIQKSGDVVTLKYTEILERNQPFATRVESVNPYAFRDWGGVMSLNPDSDVYVDRQYRVEDGGIGFHNDVISETEPIPLMREQNVQFTATRLKPGTNLFSYWSGDDMIENTVRTVPKLLEVTPIQGAFQIGEAVRGLAVSNQSGSQGIDIRFRLATPNHKDGPFNNPTITFPSNPYNSSVGLSSAYTETTSVLNVDVASLNQKSDANFFGFVSTGMRLVGETSGAEAEINNVRLISDELGAVLGCYYIPPNTFQNGTNTASLTSVKPQDLIIGQNYTRTGADHFSEGFRITETTLERVEPAPPVIPPPVIIHHTEIIERTTTIIERVHVQPPQDDDPLAQSFFVEEDAGIFLTSVDFFFFTKSETLPVDVRIVSVENGIPTNKVVKGARSILNPDQVNVSTDGTDPTNFKFEHPVLLTKGEYAWVIGSADADYQAWICQIGEVDIATADNPELGRVVVSKQPTQGSLFKSQNGTTWTPSQLEDLKYNAYKAEFTTETGTVRMYNPELNTNGSKNKLPENPIEVFSKRVTVGLNSSILGTTGSVVHIGTEIKQDNKTASGFVAEKLSHLGTAANTLSITNAGTNYENGTYSTVNFTTLTGKGSGAVGVVTVGSNSITGATVKGVQTGSGYQVGDTISAALGSKGLGQDLVLTVGVTTGVNALVLTNVTGQDFDTTNFIQRYDSSLGYGVTISPIVPSSVTVNNDQYDGTHFKVTHPNHGLHAANNKTTIAGVSGDSVPTKLTVGYAVSATGAISVGSSIGFNWFEGAQVSGANPGYALISDEIISYTSVGTNILSGTITRAVDGSFARTHQVDDPVQKYELSGVSLRRINKSHDLVDVTNTFEDKVTLDSYHVKLGAGQFIKDKHGGGDKASASSNIQFEVLDPAIAFSSPEGTTVDATVRTLSATSIGGNEVSFVDKGYESISLNKPTKFTEPRMIASRDNETGQTGVLSLPGSKSFTLDLNIATADPNVSPVIDVFKSSINTRSSRINKPVTDYITDRRSNTLDDPHDLSYLTKVIKLENPATSLKVLFAADRPGAADVRVLYRLQRVDGGGETDKIFELFPGYPNLDSAGFVINTKNNTGQSDKKTSASLDGQFVEYEFSVDDLPQFTGFQIKVDFSSSNQAEDPELLDFRAIAVA